MPIDSLGNWNIVVDSALIAAGFGVSTQWEVTAKPFGKQPRKHPGKQLLPLLSTELSTGLSTVGKRSDDLWITHWVLTPVRPLPLARLHACSAPLPFLGKPRSATSTVVLHGMHKIRHTLWTTSVIIGEIPLR